jgi:hypothetical protein
MYEITDAVILMAGMGTRLRASGEMLPKPLVPIFGRPLISYVFAALEKVGVRNLHAVIGAEGDALVAALRPLLPLSMRLNPISNPNWQKQNGVSVLCAEMCRPDSRPDSRWGICCKAAADFRRTVRKSTKPTATRVGTFPRPRCDQSAPTVHSAASALTACRGACSGRIQRGRRIQTNP